MTSTCALSFLRKSAVLFEPSLPNEIVLQAHPACRSQIGVYVASLAACACMSTFRTPETQGSGMVRQPLQVEFDSIPVHASINPASTHMVTGTRLFPLLRPEKGLSSGRKEGVRASTEEVSRGYRVTRHDWGLLSPFLLV